MSTKLTKVTDVSQNAEADPETKVAQPVEEEGVDLGVLMGALDRILDKSLQREKQRDDAHLDAYKAALAADDRAGDRDLKKSTTRTIALTVCAVGVIIVAGMLVVTGQGPSALLLLGGMGTAAVAGLAGYSIGKEKGRQEAPPSE